MFHYSAIVSLLGINTKDSRCTCNLLFSGFSRSDFYIRFGGTGDTKKKKSSFHIISLLLGRVFPSVLQTHQRLFLWSFSAASSSYFPSAGGDDRSISGSSDTSDTSQSDCSIGSRIAVWTDPASSQREGTGHTGTRAAPQSSERLPLNQAGGSRPAAKPPRQLQDIGRQSSSDSGIATGSHSSYSGSFSSYAGSLDSGPGEDFGSVFSLPPRLAQELSLCTCLIVPGREYQVPTSLRYLYDTPRSVLQEGSGDAGGGEPPALAASSGLATDSAEGDRTGAVACDPHQHTTGRDTVSERLQGPSEEGKKTVVALPGGHAKSCHSCSSKTIVTICSACGGFKVSAKHLSEQTATKMCFLCIFRLCLVQT